MKKNRMIKMAIFIMAVLILILTVVVFVFVIRKPRQIASGELEFNKQQMSIVADQGVTEETMLNQDYIENQVVAVVDSKREAKKIAKQIGGELLSYDNNVAVIQIGVTVEEMMQMLEEDSSLPKVYPNYQNYSN